MTSNDWKDRRERLERLLLAASDALRQADTAQERAREHPDDLQWAQWANEMLRRAEVNHSLATAAVQTDIAIEAAEHQMRAQATAELLTSASVRAARSTMWASWAMVLVAVATLAVATLD